MSNGIADFSFHALRWDLCMSVDMWWCHLLEGMGAFHCQALNAYVEN